MSSGPNMTLKQQKNLLILIIKTILSQIYVFHSMPLSYCPQNIFKKPRIDASRQKGRENHLLMLTW